MKHDEPGAAAVADALASAPLGVMVSRRPESHWTAPDEEVFDSHLDELRGVGVHLMGRRLYETMLYGETASQEPSLGTAEL